MKYTRLFTTLFLLSFATGIRAQVVTFLTENFNNGFPAAWTRINNDGLVPAAEVAYVNNAWVTTADPDSTSIDDSVAVATSYYDPAGSADDWMITPPITLAARGNFLTWQVKSFDPSFPDGYDVMIATTPAIDSFYANTKLFFTDFELDTWTDRSALLDSFAGQTVYIAFRAKSNDQFLLLIDNIKVYADTLTSVSEVSPETQSVSVFPNPASNVLTVDAAGNVEQARMMDISGKMVLSISPDRNRFQMDISALTPGVYILQVSQAGGIHRQLKVIKN